MPRKPSINGRSFDKLRVVGIGLAIAGQNFPDQKAVLGVIVWYLIVGGLIAFPYVQCRRRTLRKRADAGQGRGVEL